MEKDKKKPYTWHLFSILDEFRTWDSQEKNAFSVFIFYSWMNFELEILKKKTYK